jgi:hypothetical protein
MLETRERRNAVTVFGGSDGKWYSDQGPRSDSGLLYSTGS